MVDAPHDRRVEAQPLAVGRAMREQRRLALVVAQRMLAVRTSRAAMSAVRRARSPSACRITLSRSSSACRRSARSRVVMLCPPKKKTAAPAVWPGRRCVCRFGSCRPGPTPLPCWQNSPKTERGWAPRMVIVLSALTRDSAISAGLLTTVTPAAVSAAIFSAAVPCPPAMIAPAWPIRRPGGAVWPAMKATTGLVKWALIHAAASSSAEPPISPIMITASVSGSSWNSSSASMCVVPISGSPPMPMQVDWPRPRRVSWSMAS